MATSDEHAEFCERVKARRKELGLTQAEVAERMGIGMVSYSEIERGRSAPSLNRVFDVAVALDISVHALIPDPIRASK